MTSNNYPKSIGQLLKGYQPPPTKEEYYAQMEANRKARQYEYTHTKEFRRRMKIRYRAERRERRKERARILRKKQLELKKLTTPLDYNDYHDPMTQRPAEKFENPYDYGSYKSRHNEPQDRTNAAVEAKEIFQGEVELFDRKLFPAQNSKRYNEKSGREFLADFTKATRGQLVVSMSRLAQENPREFARIWIEMEKFNTPQQTAVDLNANVTAKASLYDRLQSMSEPQELDIPDELAEECSFNTQEDHSGQINDASTPYPEEETPDTTVYVFYDTDTPTHQTTDDTEQVTDQSHTIKDEQG